MEPASFISTQSVAKLLSFLTKSIKSNIDKRNQELIRINDVFGNCLELAKFYIQPNCQQINPADEIEDETISSIRAEVFETINNFFHRDILTRDGASQMFILADAGMGKTSLLMMIKLSYLMSFWPRNYHCQLLKLGRETLNDIRKIENKSQTILLLDSLDEDPQCKQGGTSERLTKILEETTCFYRVIITCRTQFFPETAESAFNTLGKISFKNFDCPLIYLSLFTNEQVDSYLEKRYPKSLRFISNRFENPKKEDAKKAIKGINSLQFRPFLLSHVETLLESHKQGATEYELYKGLVIAWLNREVIKLRINHGQDFNRDDLLKACVWLAEIMHRNNTHTVGLKHVKQICNKESNIALLKDSAEKTIEGIDHIDIGTNSLLNRNSYGEFRFSHLSIREFLIVYGVELNIIQDKGDYFSKTDNMLNFIKAVNKSKIGLFVNEYNGCLLTEFKLQGSNQLNGINLQYASLERSDLTGASLDKVNLENANLLGANLRNASLQGANLKGINLKDANLQGANFRGANLEGANLQRAYLNGAIFDDANLSSANLLEVNHTTPSKKDIKREIVSFVSATLQEADLSKAKLEGANLTKAILTKSKFFASILSEANLSFAHLNESDFKSANVTKTNFEKADLTKSDFGGADLSGANLLEAKMAGCNLTQANLLDSNISEDQRSESIFRKFKNESAAKKI